MNEKKIIILGTGGNCIDILDAINEINLIRQTYKIIGFLDDDISKLGKEYYGIKVLGGLNKAKEFKSTYFVNGIGSPNNFWKKEVILNKLNISLEWFETIIHPTASVSKLATVGKGSVILQNTTIASNVKIGNHVMILPNCVINHDDIIEDYVSITSGVCVSGGVVIKESSYIGSGSTIIGNIIINKNALIGMGSVVLKDVEKNSIVVGNPAKFLKRLNITTI
ncbi:NeuD/PglB/VioB family sugar acetyltransferase [Arcobacter nitrofigilis]|nr:NeuD/PglB/VioB family sugar acetyltransferase [Arcobacter nitrofigilis]